MKRHTLTVCTLLLGIGFLPLAGCDREVAREREVDIKDDGTVKTKEKTVSESTDGSTTVTEEKSVTKPD